MGNLTVERCFDVELLNAIVRDESIYPQVMRDCDPPAAKFDLTSAVSDQRNLFLLARSGYENIGFWMFRPCGGGVYEIHTSILGPHRGKTAYKATALASEYMFVRTDCLGLTSSVPECNETADVFARHFGMRTTRVTKGDFVKDGKAYNQQWFYIDLIGWFLHNRYKHHEENGALFHANLETQLGHPNHPEDLLHNECVSVSLSMLFAGMLNKAEMFYNSLAPILAHFPAHVLGYRFPWFVVRMDNLVIRIDTAFNVEIVEGVQCQ